METYLLSLGKAYLESYQGLSQSCWRGILLSFIEAMLMGVFYFLSIYFVGVLHLNVTTAGTIISCYGLGAIAGGFVGGKLSDKLSPAIVSIGSILLQAVGYLLLLKLSQVEWLMMNVFLLGAAGYGFITSNYLWVLSQCHHQEAQKLKAINLLSTASNLGLGLSALLISAIAGEGFKTIFLISSVCLLLLAAYLILKEINESRINKIKYAISAASVAIKESVSGKNQLINILILSCVLFVGLIVSQLSSTYPLYIQASFPLLGIKAVSILFTINSFLVVLFEAPLGNFCSDYNKVLMVGIGGCLIGLGMLMLSFSRIFIWAIFSCIIYTAGEILFFCMAQFICYQKGSERKKGSSLGMYRMIYASSRVIGPVIGSFIYHQMGGNMVWYISGVIGVMCLLFCNAYKKYE